MQPPKFLETNRLFLRQPVSEDGIHIFEGYARDKDVTKYLTWQPHRSILMIDKYVNRCIDAWANKSAFPYVLIRKIDSQLVGMIEIRINKHKADLGYVLAKSEWGKGYMPEAANTLIELALLQSNIYRVWAVCDLENHASTRVMEKIGMQKEGILKKWIVHPNISSKPRDCYCYAAIK